jgi:hypothetical protein
MDLRVGTRQDSSLRDSTYHNITAAGVGWHSNVSAGSVVEPARDERSQVLLRAASHRAPILVLRSRCSDVLLLLPFRETVAVVCRTTILRDSALRHRMLLQPGWHHTELLIWTITQL